MWLIIVTDSVLSCCARQKLHQHFVETVLNFFTVVLSTGFDAWIWMATVFYLCMNWNIFTLSKSLKWKFLAQRQWCLKTVFARYDNDENFYMKDSLCIAVQTAESQLGVA